MGKRRRNFANNNAIGRPLDAEHSSRKRRRYIASVSERQICNFLSSGNSFSPLASLDSQLLRTNILQSQSEPSIDCSPPMASSGFGSNRLKSGFVKSSAMSGNTGVEDTVRTASGSSSRSVQSLSDENMQDSDQEGGMTLNVEGSIPNPILISDEEGEYSGSNSDVDDGDNLGSTQTPGELHRRKPEAESQLHVALEDARVTPDNVTFVIDTSPTQPVTKLSDLEPAQLEKQLKYTFWNLNRDEIDLSRPAICLVCHDEGHIDEACAGRYCSHCGAQNEHDSRLCPQNNRCTHCRETGHEARHCVNIRKNTIPCDLCGLHGHVEHECSLRHYTRSKIPDGEVEMWISCCICASKAHLVGDCPKAESSRAARWSLKPWKNTKVINLSMQNGTRKLEIAAENRGMRPPGMQIKGRAQQMYAKNSKQYSSDEEDDKDQFLSRPSNRVNSLALRTDQYRPPPSMDRPRYDRFDAPSDNYRPPPRSGWYATDSFGRRRSGSPGYRRNERPPRRTPSPSGDFYRPRNSEGRRQSSPPKNHPSRNSKTPTSLRKNISVVLPNKKATETSSSKSAVSQPSLASRIDRPQPNNSQSNDSSAASAGEGKGRQRRRGKKTGNKG